MADRINWRVARAGGFGLILMVGGLAALAIPRHRADYRISTLEILGYVTALACGGALAGHLILSLAAATLGFILGGAVRFGRLSGSGY